LENNFPNHFTIQLIFLPYIPMFSSYQKQALTVMISPLGTNCHDIAVILLNVALHTINLYTDICLPLAGKDILKPCSGSKFSYCSKNGTMC
jgi:hypothetical protein